MEGENVITICRLCLNGNGSLMRVFEPKVIHGRLPADVIIELLQLEVSEDDIYPQCVCAECMKKLEDFKEFKERCVTNKKLLDRAFAVKRLSPSGTGVNRINAQNDCDPLDIDTGADEVITADVPLLQPKDEIQDPLAFDESEEEAFTCASEWEANPEKVALDSREKEHTVKVESRQCTASEDASDSTEKERGFTRKIYKCQDCGKEYICPEEYKLHIHEHEVGDNFTCDHCGTCFPNEKSFRAHKRALMLQKVNCGICGKTFKNNHRLKNHMVFHREKRYVCDECGKSFHRLCDLREHKSSHSSETIHLCDICNKLCNSKKLLLSHRNVHAGQKRKKYTCAVCGLKMITPSHLDEHMRTHTGERPFSCPQCSKIFARKRNLLVHVKRRHMKQKSEPLIVVD